MQTPFLQVRDIVKTFPGVRALDDVFFQVELGTVHAIVGENGAGKSTLMNILSGVFPPTSGTIEVDGRQTAIRSPRQAQNLGIAMIHQELSLAAPLTVMENMFLGRLPKTPRRTVDYKKLRADSQKYLDQLGVRDVRPDMLIRELSVAQMQLVEIAKALSYNAKVIIMDEPTASISKKEVGLLFDIIRSLKEKHVAVLYISHIIEEIFTISDKVTVLRDGRWIGTKPTAELSPNEVISMMVGRAYKAHERARTKQVDYSGAPILEVRHLTESRRLKDVSFKLYKGEILAVTGLVGAGRSETMNAIFGVTRATGGEIYVDGKPAVIKSPPDAIRYGLGMIPESRKDDGLFLQLPVCGNMTISALKKYLRGGFISSVLERAAASRYAKMFNIKMASLDTPIQNLSGGNQQKAIVSRWLMNEPRILILDEPTHGVDVNAKEEILEIIAQLAEQGMSVILVSSELGEVINTADRIIVMASGVVTGELVNQGVTQEMIMEYAVKNVNG